MKTIHLKLDLSGAKKNEFFFLYFVMTEWKESHAHFVHYIIYYFITCSVQKIFHSVLTLVPSVHNIINEWPKDGKQNENHFVIYSRAFS